jgi:hypothetical protein
MNQKNISVADDPGVMKAEKFLTQLVSNRDAAVSALQEARQTRAKNMAVAAESLASGRKLNSNFQAERAAEQRAEDDLALADAAVDLAKQSLASAIAEARKRIITEVTAEYHAAIREFHRAIKEAASKNRRVLESITFAWSSGPRRRQCTGMI